MSKKTQKEADKKDPGRKEAKETKLRLPRDFHWKLMQKFAEDLEKSQMGSLIRPDLKKFKVAVRGRDIETYLSDCKTQWSLKELIPYASGSEICSADLLKLIRGKRLLTLWQKYKFPESQINRKQKALDIFDRFERRCRRTNCDEIFTEKFDNDNSSLSTYDNLVTYKHLRRVRQFIARTLGESPDLDDFLKALRHGPGASTDKRGDNSIPIEKFIPPIGVSPSACSLFAAVLSSDERWTRSILDLWCAALPNGIPGLLSMDIKPMLSEFLVPVSTSTIMTVPKSAEVDRTISIEPTANVYMQLAVDSIIRNRLKQTWNIDINTQEKNQKLAQFGSLTNSLVTVDLSGASDSIALTWLNFFPEKWKKLLSCLRMTHGTMPNGTVVPFHKLSAMGNGYTFAIETLVFAAMIYAVVRENNEHWRDVIPEIAVYGDDIVIPSRFYGEYSYLLHRLGFLENVEKTFSWGPIRESCGRDYYMGERVDRPTLKDHPERFYELVIMHNTLYEIGTRYGINFDGARDLIVKYIPENERHYGPPNEDLVGWIHSASPPDGKGNFYHKDYQGLYYTLKRNVVGHPTRYKDLMKKGKIDITKIPRHIRYFVPLVFCKSSSSQKREPCVRLLRNQSILDWKRMTDCAAEPQTDYGLFLKARVRVRTSKTIIPIQEWPCA